MLAQLGLDEGRWRAGCRKLLLCGGQLCLPFYGAVATNCELDRSRAKGPSQWGANMKLHVSAGIGTSPYAPVRFCCRPEATLLTLVATPTKGSVLGTRAGQAHPTVSAR